MVERQIPWTTNLDQLAISIVFLGLVLGTIIFVIERCR